MKMSTVYLTTFEQALKLAKELIAKGELRKYHIDRDDCLCIDVLTNDNHWLPFWDDSEPQFENYIP